MGKGATGKTATVFLLGYIVAMKLIFSKVLRDIKVKLLETILKLFSVLHCDLLHMICAELTMGVPIFLSWFKSLQKLPYKN